MRQDLKGTIHTDIVVKFHPANENALIPKVIKASRVFPERKVTVSSLLTAEGLCFSSVDYLTSNSTSLGTRLTESYSARTNGFGEVFQVSGIKSFLRSIFSE